MEWTVPNVHSMSSMRWPPFLVSSLSRSFSHARLGSVRLRATHVGVDTTFGKVIKLVEEAEAHRANVQRLADRFSSYFLPVVVIIALLTFVISRNPLSTAAVLVVACSCSLALATPIAMLASIGAAAIGPGRSKRGGCVVRSRTVDSMPLIVGPASRIRSMRPLRPRST